MSDASGHIEAVIELLTMRYARLSEVEAFRRNVGFAGHLQEVNYGIDLAMRQFDSDTKINDTKEALAHHKLAIDRVQELLDEKKYNESQRIGFWLVIWEFQDRIHEIDPQNTTCQRDSCDRTVRSYRAMRSTTTGNENRIYHVGFCHKCDNGIRMGSLYEILIKNHDTVKATHKDEYFATLDAAKRAGV